MYVVKKPGVSSDNQSLEDNRDNIEDINVDGNLNTSPTADVGDSFHIDIIDPRYWDSLDSKQIDILAEKGPQRDTSYWDF